MWKFSLRDLQPQKYLTFYSMKSADLKIVGQGFSDGKAGNTAQQLTCHQFSEGKETGAHLDALGCSGSTWVAAPTALSGNCTTPRDLIAGLWNPNYKLWTKAHLLESCSGFNYLQQTWTPPRDSPPRLPPVEGCWLVTYFSPHCCGTGLHHFSSQDYACLGQGESGSGSPSESQHRHPRFLKIQ